MRFQLLPLLSLLVAGVGARESPFLRTGASTPFVESSEAVLIQPRPRELLQFSVVWKVGDNGEPAEAFPLGMCDGDCDDDDDCGENMICFQRDGGEAVPGCIGGENDLDDTDYCISDSEAPTMAPSAPLIQIVQDGRVDRSVNISSLFQGLVPLQPPANPYNLSLSSGLQGTLGKCQGICKSDRDCAVGLACFRRNLGGDVPHCEFDDFVVKNSPHLLDFCTLPQTTEPSSSPSLSPTHPPTFPPTPEPTPQPTHPPTVLLMQPNMARLIGMYTEGYLARCEANCWNDWECAGDLVCWGQSNNQDIPGCYFDEGAPDAVRRSSDINICIDQQSIPWFATRLKPEDKMTARFIGAKTDGNLGRCEGHCRNDWECAGDLVCWGRHPGMGAPGCNLDQWDADAIQREDDYSICVDQNHIARGFERIKWWLTPPEDAWAQFVGNVTEEGNLQRCTGNCRNDWECEDDLICWERVEGMPAPGCYFDHGLPGGMAREDSHNVCIDKRNIRNYHRLRLWWQPGYRWQDEGDEQFWCMQQAGESVVVERCSSSYRQIWEMVYLPGGEALIKSVPYQLCLRGGGPNLRECQEDDAAQMWIPMNGAWDGLHFELTRRGYEDFCITNPHHPRSGEAINMRGCERERNYTTSAWSFWW